MSIVASANSELPPEVQVDTLRLLRTANYAIGELKLYCHHACIDLD